MANVTRATSNGPIAGFIDTHPTSDVSSFALAADGPCAPVLKFLGVPYGQAKRWENPTLPTPWTETKPTVEFGTMFPQPPSGTDAIYGGKEGVIPRAWVKQSEDSHFLNVFSPADIKQGEKLPVLVWIYGGSLNNGSSDRFLYDPTEWIRRAGTERFIVVTVNYRVNIFGYFSGPDVLAADGVSGNYGNYDCIAALEWVHANAEAFNIDTSRVTAFGESAGAYIVASLLVSGKKLFNRAIMQSGAPGTMQIRPLEKAYPAYAPVLNFHGIGAATPKARIAALRALSWEELLAAHTANQSFGGVGLTIEQEGGIWTESLADAIAKRGCDAHIKEVIIGTNEDEGTMFAMMMPGLATPEGFAGYISKFAPATQARYETLYPPSTLTALAKGDYINSPVSKVIAEQLFIEPAQRLADSLAAKGTKVYFYRCRETVDRLISEKLNLGSMHSIEISLVFNIKGLWEEESKEAKTSKVMGDNWISFAATGAPHPEWKEYSTAAPAWFAFGGAGHAAMETVA